MADERDEYQGWQVVEGPGTEDADQNEGPAGRELGEPPVLGTNYGASTGGVDGEPGPPGAAMGEIPEHTGPVAITGIEDLYTPGEDED